MRDYSNPVFWSTWLAENGIVGSVEPPPASILSLLHETSGGAAFLMDWATEPAFREEILGMEPELYTAIVYPYLGIAPTLPPPAW